MNEQNDRQLTSFQFYVMPGQSLVYNNRTETPPGPPTASAYYVSVSLAEITIPVAKEWLKQNVAPLIGPDAMELIEPFINREDVTPFWEAVVEYRKSQG